jgi:hypothetical protein
MAVIAHQPTMVMVAIAHQPTMVMAVIVVNKKMTNSYR